MRWWLLVLTACGRIGFGLLGDGAGIDVSTTGCVPQTETCNGIDDDCDGLVDEGCPCTPFSVTIATPQNPVASQLIWTGTDYILRDATSGKLDIVDGTGAITGTIAVSPMPGDGLMWDGTAPVLANDMTGGAVTLSHVMTGGSLVPFASVPTPGSGVVWIARDRTGEYELAWPSSSMLSAVTLAADGTPVTSVVTLSTSVPEQLFDGFARATATVAAWTNLAQSMSEVETFSGSSVTIGNTFTLAVAGTATGFIVAAANPNNGKTFDLYTLDPDGQQLGQPTPITLPGGLFPSQVIATAVGSGYVIVAVASTASTDLELERVSVDLAGVASPASMMLSATAPLSFSFVLPAMWADAVRTGVVMSYSNGSTSVQKLVQTCP